MKWPTCMLRPTIFQTDWPTGDNIGQYWNSVTPGLVHLFLRCFHSSLEWAHLWSMLPWPLWRFWVCRWTYTFPLLAHHPPIQLISLPSRDSWWHFAATPPGLDIPQLGNCLQLLCNSWISWEIKTWKFCKVVCTNWSYLAFYYSHI